MVAQWRISLQVAQATASAHTACVRTADDVSGAAYNASLQLLAAAQQRGMAANDAVAAAASAHAAQCHALEVAVLLSIHSWMQAGAALSYNEGECSTAEVAYVRLLVGDIDSSTASNASTSAAFLNSTGALMADAESSAEARVAYDAAYVASGLSGLQLSAQLLLSLSDPFATIELPASLTALDGPVEAVLGCVVDAEEADGSANGLCSASLAALYQPTVDGLVLALAQAQAGFEAALQQADAFSAPLLAALQRCQSLFAYLQSFEVALGAIGVDVDLLPSLPSLAPFSFDGDATAVEAALQVEAVEEAFARLFAPAELAFRASVADVEAAVQQTATAFVARMQNLSLQLPSLFPGYNPPAVDLQVSAIALTADATVAAYIQQAMAALTSSNSSLALQENSSAAASNWTAAAAWRSSAAEASNDSSAAEAAVGGFQAALASSAATAPSALSAAFAPFTGSVDVDGLVASLGGLFLVALIADWVWRSYTSLHILVALAKVHRTHAAPAVELSVSVSRGSPSHPPLPCARPAACEGRGPTIRCSPWIRACTRSDTARLC